MKIFKITIPIKGKDFEIFIQSDGIFGKTELFNLFNYLIIKDKKNSMGEHKDEQEEWRQCIDILEKIDNCDFRVNSESLLSGNYPVGEEYIKVELIRPFFLNRNMHYNYEER